MHRLLLGLSCLVTLAAFPQAQDLSAPPRPRTIKTVRFMSEALGAVRTFGLLLPPDYDQSTRRYPVLYLLHGSGQQHSTWGRQTLLASTTGMIVVMPDTDRARYVLSDGTIDPRYDTFVASELMNYVDARYRTVAARQGRAIGGISIGGFGAMVLGLAHPDRFVAIGALSAPYEAGGVLPSLIRGGAPVPAIYMGCGTADPLVGSNRRFAALLEERHVMRRYEERPGAHDWSAWDDLLAHFIAMLKTDYFLASSS